MLIFKENKKNAVVNKNFMQNNHNNNRPQVLKINNI